MEQEWQQFVAMLAAVIVVSTFTALGFLIVTFVWRLIND
jgi:hypothetical protein